MASRNKINDLCNEEGNGQQDARMMGTNESWKELVPWNARFWVPKPKQRLEYGNIILMWKKIAEFLKELKDTNSISQTSVK